MATRHLLGQRGDLEGALRLLDQADKEWVSPERDLSRALLLEEIHAETPRELAQAALNASKEESRTAREAKALLARLTAART
jgi:hypothetical protein